MDSLPMVVTRASGILLDHWGTRGRFWDTFAAADKRAARIIPAMSR